MIAGHNDGIDLDTSFHWIVEGIKQPEPFFTSLASLLPADAILYVEGGRIAPEVATLYEAHLAQKPVAVVRDTLFPEPDIYHVNFSSEVAARLRELATTRPPHELCDHLKAYRENSLLFTFHDAFDGWLLISEHVSESVVAEFCRTLGVACRRELTKKRDPEQFRAFLNALEHPDKVRIKRKPWWRELCEGFAEGWKEE